MIAVLPGFLPDHYCHTLITSIINQYNTYLGHASVNRVEIPCWEATPEARDVLRTYRDMVTEMMRRKFDQRVVVEYLMLQANEAGDGHQAHCDNCTFDGGPNHTPHRSHTCNLYLANAQQGGELNFPELGITMKATPGTLVAFPSHRGFMHEVWPVVAGVRYSVLGWFTRDASREMRAF